MASELFVFPTSFAQQRLWFLDQMVPGNPLYNMSKAVRFPIAITTSVFKKSLNEIVRRHETLRTTFKSINGEPFQVVASVLDLDLTVVDLTHFSVEEREARAAELANKEGNAPFDLATGPLVRMTLLKLDYTDYVLIFCMHHIISDQWSANVFFEELTTIYDAFLQGKPSPLPELPIQYADFAVWQREYLRGQILEDHLGYWRKQLADLPQLNLPTDKVRPAFQSYQGKLKKVEPSSALSAKVRKFSQQQNATLFMTFSAAFVALLHRYCQQDDIVLGMPIAGRHHTETEKLIGFFVNSLVMRVDVSERPGFAELLQRVKRVSLDAYAHGELPFEKLVEELHPQRDPGRNPLFQALFQLEHAKEAIGSTGGIGMPSIDVNIDVAKFDLTLSMLEVGGEFAGTMEYNTDLFLPSTIERMIRHYLNLLEQAVDHPDIPIADLQMLTHEEEQQLLVEWNDTTKGYPTDLFVHELLEQHAYLQPQHVALFWQDGQLTYAELNEEANRVAHYLISKGVGPETLVVVCMERGAPMIVAHLGILKAGGAFVPMDVAYPKERLAFMLEDTAAQLLITDSVLMEQIPIPAGMEVLSMDREDLSRFPASSPRVSLSLDNRAYVIYTSGSTGRPKGVELTHKGLLNMVQWFHEIYKVGVQDRITQMSTPAYDAYIFELFPALTSGASICIIDSISRTSAVELKDKFLEQQITVSFLTTSLAEAALGLPWPEETALRFMATGGEKLMGLPGSRLPFTFLNLYGPTESTIVASYHAIEPEEKYSAPPIGRPISNSKLYVLDSSLNPVPVGVPGELFIGGLNLARGYLKRPGLTAEKFIADPFSDEPGQRLYRTGDLVRYLTDGNLDFLGRLDTQVKLRGFRIELEEIEKALHNYEGTREAVVMLQELNPGNTSIIAYLSLHSQHESVTAEELRNYLKEQLPQFMMPAHFVILPELPKSYSGKVDRAVLRKLNIADQSLTRSPKKGGDATTDMEQMVHGVWKEVLGVDEVSVEENFFDVGGHSLLMAQVYHKLKERMEPGKDMQLMNLFQYTTIRSLAKYLGELPVIKTTDKRITASAVEMNQNVRDRGTKQREAAFSERHGWYKEK